MSTTDALLKHNEAYARDFDKGDLPMPPGRKMASDGATMSQPKNCCLPGVAVRWNGRATSTS